MAEETIDISRFAVEAASSIADLKSNISNLKAELNDTNLSWEDQKKILAELQTNQAALKNAMHGTATSWEQIAKAAKGADDSYNGLVRQMAKAKEQLRAIDTSTAEGVEAFKAKAREVNALNSRLKDLDALQGNYQRNVGNYKSALDGLSGAFKSTAGSAASMINPIAGATTGLKALSATPAVAILGLLANVITKVVEGLKSSEENTMAMKSALAAFEPIMTLTTKGLQKMADWLIKIVEWAGKAARWLGIVKGDAADMMKGLVDAENQLVIDQRNMAVYESEVNAKIADLQAKASDKLKHTAKERKAFAEEAQRLSEELFNKQYELAERELELIEQRASLTENSAEDNEKIAQAKIKLNNLDAERAQRLRSLTRLENGATSAMKESTKATEKQAKAEEKRLRTWNDLQKVLTAQEKARAEEQAETDKMLEAASAELTASIQADLDAQLNAEWETMQAEKRIQQQRLATFMAYTATLSDVAGALADIYEADAEADEQAAQKAKSLKVASSILSTINGAVAAYTSTWAATELPLSVKMVLAPVNAAAVLAAGYAQVKQMNAVKVGSSTGGAVAAAPAFSPAIAMTRNVTGRNEEERLNRMAADNRVYIVYSDIEVAQHGQRVKVRETEF